MPSPFDAAWNVAKGEAFHPSAAGYMAAGHGGKRAARPNAEPDNRSRGPPSFVKPSMANMPLRPTLFEGRGKPVGPTGEPDPFEFDFTGHPDQSMEYARRFLNDRVHFDTQGMADRHDNEQEVHLPEPMLQRSSDTPIDTAWSILKFGYHSVQGANYPMREKPEEGKKDKLAEALARARKQKPDPPIEFAPKLPKPPKMPEDPYQMQLPPEFVGDATVGGDFRNADFSRLKL